MSSNAPVPYTANDVVIPAGFTESVDLLIQTYAQDLTPREFGMALASAHNRGLSIVKKQIYFWKQGGKVIEVVGIDGYRAQAESSGEYAGQVGPYWCGEDGVWKDVWLSKEPPLAAKVGVRRRGFEDPIFEVALLAEYNAPNKEIWKKLPTVMLAKCAEARALRKAFPENLGGTYTAEELDQAKANAIETTGTVRASSRQQTPRQATATVSDPERDTARKALWDLAHGTYGWSKDTLDAVAVNETGKRLTELSAQDMQALTVTIATHDPAEIVTRATAIEAQPLAGI